MHAEVSEVGVRNLASVGSIRRNHQRPDPGPHQHGSPGVGAGPYRGDFALVPNRTVLRTLYCVRILLALHAPCTGSSSG